MVIQGMEPRRQGEVACWGCDVPRRGEMRGIIEDEGGEGNGPMRRGLLN